MSVPAKDSRLDRGARRDLTAIATGAFSGLLGGLLLGSTLVGATPSGLALGGGLGAVAGALFGRFVSDRMSTDDWDPGESKRAHVGLSAPDEPSEDQQASEARRPAVPRSARSRS